MATLLMTSAFLFVLTLSPAKADDIWYLMGPNGTIIIAYSGQQAYMMAQQMGATQIISSAAWQALVAEQTAVVVAAPGATAVAGTGGAAGAAGAGALTTLGSVAAPVLITGAAIVVVGGLWYYEYEYLYSINGGFPPSWTWVPMSP